MSFSLDVKKELSMQFGEGRHCRIAEMSAIICCIGDFKNNILKIQTENINTAKKFYQLVQNDFNIKCKINITKKNQFKGNAILTVIVNDMIVSKKILQSTGILTNSDGNIKKTIPMLIIASDCCKRAYVRGVFLSCGSISNPERNNHLEFVTSDQTYSELFFDILMHFDLYPKMIIRKNHFVIYLKGGEKISDVLNLMNAYKALMKYENQRIVNELNNEINRKVNFQNANMDKAMNAAMKQIQEINLIENTIGLSSLPVILAEIAVLRKNNPDISLSELGNMLNPPIGKSGVNHRLRKISNISREIKATIICK